jgi:hypothetical protein
MPTIVGQKALQIIGRKLPFCYLCGKVFTVDEKLNRDHVPPSACIAVRDKAQSPLILPTHPACNAAFKVDDERAGQFLSILHGKLAARENRRLKYKQFFAPGKAREAVTNVDMYGVVTRWVRAFHAALYMQPLPPNTRFATELPFEVISPLGDGRHIIDDGRPRQRTLCEETLASNRLTKTIDRLVAWNGKLQYECVWVLTPMHAYCVFWLDFYNWERLARLTGRPPMDCVGLYELPLTDLPAQATTESQIITGRRTLQFGL